MPAAGTQTTRILFEAPALELGEFRCAPEHPRWREVNDIGGRPHVVFPGTSVYLDRRGGIRLLATPNDVVFYASHELYRRALHDPRGDHCVFVTVDPALLESIAGRPRLPRHGTSEAGLYLAVHLLVRRLRAAAPDALETEETLLRLVSAAVARGHRPEARRRAPARPTTIRAHRELAEAAKAELARRVADAISLADLAAALHTSAYHLARVFRATSGFSLHDYRIHLRLRRSLALVADPAADLTRVGLELGFCSPSHFSGSFRRVFGVTPSAVRSAGPAELRELSKIVEARLSQAA